MDNKKATLNFILILFSLFILIIIFFLTCNWVTGLKGRYFTQHELFTNSKWRLLGGSGDSTTNYTDTTFSFNLQDDNQLIFTEKNLNKETNSYGSWTFNQKDSLIKISFGTSSGLSTITGKLISVSVADLTIELINNTDSNEEGKIDFKKGDTVSFLH